MDFGSAVSRQVGISEEQLRSLSHAADSDAYSDLEKLAISYAEHMTRTPAEVPDELFAALRQHLDAAQLVELTATIAWENYTARFNRAMGVEPEGFSEGAYCLVPEP